MRPAKPPSGAYCRDEIHDVSRGRFRCLKAYGKSSFYQERLNRTYFGRTSLGDPSIHKQARAQNAYAPCASVPGAPAIPPSYVWPDIIASAWIPRGSGCSHIAIAILAVRQAVNPFPWILLGNREVILSEAPVEIPGPTCSKHLCSFLAGHHERVAS